MRINHTAIELLKAGDPQFLTLEEEYDAPEGTASITSDLLCGRAEVYVHPRGTGSVCAFNSRRGTKTPIVWVPGKAHLFPAVR
jgi:hypothetical protein